MKRVITAVCFILTAVFLAVFGYFDLKKTCESLIDSLQNVVEVSSSDNNEETVAAAEECARLWEEKGERLEMYLNHSEIDSVEIDFKSLKRYAEGEQDIMLTEVCYECINNLEHIIETETPSWGTVL